MIRIEEEEGVRDFIQERLGDFCVDCGMKIIFDFQLSIKSCDPTCIYCEKKFGY